MHKKKKKKKKRTVTPYKLNTLIYLISQVLLVTPFRRRRKFKILILIKNGKHDKQRRR